MKIRALKEKFIKKGVEYTQVKKNSRYIVYSCKMEDMKEPYYELFKYKLGNPHPFDAEEWDKIELYPSNESFGVWAWCCSNRQILLKTFQRLAKSGIFENKQKEKQ